MDVSFLRDKNFYFLLFLNLSALFFFLVRSYNLFPFSTIVLGGFWLVMLFAFSEKNKYGLIFTMGACSFYLAKHLQDIPFAKAIDILILFTALQSVVSGLSFALRESKKL